MMGSVSRPNRARATWPSSVIGHAPGEALKVVMRDADKEDKIAACLALHRSAEHVDKHPSRRFGIPALC
ncbi:hypothetical protein ABIB83_008808 [Bradyrhizobium sp. I1.8.5]